MTLSVSSDSDSLTINTDKADGRDFLRCHSKPDEADFLRWVPASGTFTFDENLLPSSFLAKARVVADNWLDGLAVRGREAEEVEMLFDKRENKRHDLLECVARLMCRGVLVNSIDADGIPHRHPNIGLRLQATHRPPVPTGYRIAPWVADLPIVKVVPMTRIQVLRKKTRW